jgi:SAM-dependent methyltransferase
MAERRTLPGAFLERLSALEASYLEEDDPIRQSGFGGGQTRWRREREPILDALDRDGSILDVGCANGHLLRCLVEWGAERGLALDPWGLDQGRGLVALARAMWPERADRFFAGNAWDWNPPRRFRYVYSLCDCVPEDFLEEYVGRLLGRFVASGGRLILGAYGSRSRREPPFPVAGFLADRGFPLAGTATGGEPPVARFAWVDAPGRVGGR